MLEKTAFRGLFKHLNAELSSSSFEEGVRLTLTFDTLNSKSSERIRFSLTRAYLSSLPYSWCVADLCEYALQHELAESVPALFVAPDHRPGALDDDVVARDHAQKALERYHEDVAMERWDGSRECMREQKPTW